MVVEQSKHLIRSRSMLSLSNTMTDDERSVREMGIPGGRKKVEREQTIPEGIAMKTFQTDTDTPGELSNGDVITMSPVQMSPQEESRRELWHEPPQNRALTFDDPWKRVRANQPDADDRPPSPDTPPQRTVAISENEAESISSRRRFSNLSNISRRVSNMRRGSAERIMTLPYLTFTPTIARNSVPQIVNVMSDIGFCRLNGRTTR